ncbi:MAG: tight adherence protein [Cryptosporangiaceae bacterium]|nr:tight adherence protein [Cryptosporangiaceae bacterium]
MGALLGLVAGLGLLLIWRSGPRAVPIRRAPGARWGQRRTEVLREAGVSGVSGGQLLAIQFAAAVVTGLLVLGLSRSVSVAACFAVFGFFAPMAVVRRLHRRRRSDLREVWPEVVDNLASAVRAGMGLPEAVASLAIRGPEPLRPAFARFAADYRASGRFSDCLYRLRAELADPVGDRVCESLRIARDVGGSDLGRLLRTLSGFLREDGRTRAELETRQGWTVNAARLAVAAPWIVLLMFATNETNLAAYDSLPGRVLLAVGGAVSVFAYRLMMRIGRLPEERRVLR